MTRMHDPAHPGEITREALEAVQWTIAEAALRLGVSRNTLSRVLNGKASVSPRLALALEQLGWSDAGHWVRIQAAYDLAHRQQRRTPLTAGTDRRTPDAKAD